MHREFNDDVSSYDDDAVGYQQKGEPGESDDIGSSESIENSMMTCLPMKMTRSVLRNHQSRNPAQFRNSKDAPLFYSISIRWMCFHSSDDVKGMIPVPGTP
jgi:hypothetical protein